MKLKSSLLVIGLWAAIAGCGDERKPLVIQSVPYPDGTLHLFFNKYKNTWAVGVSDQAMMSSYSIDGRDLHYWIESKFKDSSNALHDPIPVENPFEQQIWYGRKVFEFSDSVNARKAISDFLKEQATLRHESAVREAKKRVEDSLKVLYNKFNLVN